MGSIVSVNFAENRRYEVEVDERDLPASTPESARRWFEDRFMELGCEPANPTGKTLLVDKILGVARAMGEKPFARSEPSAREFAGNAVRALERGIVSIDLAALSVR